MYCDWYRIVTRMSHLYKIYPIVARRAWPVQPLGRVRRASKGILRTNESRDQAIIPGRIINPQDFWQKKLSLYFIKNNKL